MVVLSGALVTGLTFHHISILEAQGLTEHDAIRALSSAIFTLAVSLLTPLVPTRADR